MCVCVSLMYRINLENLNKTMSTLDPAAITVCFIFFSNVLSMDFNSCAAKKKKQL